MLKYQQAAAIPFRKANDRLQILLITSRNNKKWIIPKGLIEKGDSAKVTAEKETFEEAGASGKIAGGILGSYEYKKWGGTCFVKVFALQVNDILDEWDEDFRKREWVDGDIALKKVQPAALKKIMRKFIKKIWILVNKRAGQNGLHKIKICKSGNKLVIV